MKAVYIMEREGFAVLLVALLLAVICVVKGDGLEDLESQILPGGKSTKGTKTSESTTEKSDAVIDAEPGFPFLFNVSTPGNSSTVFTVGNSTNSTAPPPPKMTEGQMIKSLFSFALGQLTDYSHEIKFLQELEKNGTNVTEFMNNVTKGYITEEEYYRRRYGDDYSSRRYQSHSFMPIPIPIFMGGSRFGGGFGGFGGGGFGGFGRPNYKTAMLLAALPHVANKVGFGKKKNHGLGGFGGGGFGGGGGGFGGGGLGGMGGYGNMGGYGGGYNQGYNNRPGGYGNPYGNSYGTNYGTNTGYGNPGYGNNYGTNYGSNYGGQYGGAGRVGTGGMNPPPYSPGVGNGPPPGYGSWNNPSGVGQAGSPNQPPPAYNSWNNQGQNTGRVGAPAGGNPPPYGWNVGGAGGAGQSSSNNLNSAPGGTRTGSNIGWNVPGSATGAGAGSATGAKPPPYGWNVPDTNSNSKPASSGSSGSTVTKPKSSSSSGNWFTNVFGGSKSSSSAIGSGSSSSSGSSSGSSGSRTRGGGRSGGGRGGGGGRKG